MTLKRFIREIEIILEKPGMYRVETVNDINLFVIWEIHMRRNKKISDFFGGFDEFVKKSNDKSFKGFGWSKIIMLQSGSNMHSLILFKQYLDNYLDSPSSSCFYERKRSSKAK